MDEAACRPASAERPFRECAARKRSVILDWASPVRSVSMSRWLSSVSFSENSSENSAIIASSKSISGMLHLPVDPWRLELEIGMQRAQALGSPDHQIGGRRHALGDDAQGPFLAG